MAAALTWTDADATSTNLHDGAIYKLLDIAGLEMAPLDHHEVRTPLQDGSTYVRTLLDPRFVTLSLLVAGSSYENFYTRRQALSAAFNPKVGQGTLTYKPDSTGVAYALDCFVSRFQIARKSEKIGIATIQFMANDPTFYDTSQNNPNIAVAPTELEFPIEFPVQFGPSTASSTIANGGDVVSWPVISNDAGAFTGVRFYNVTTDKYINLPQLDVASGETLTVDMGAKTIDVDGTSAISYLTSDSEFWSLATGNNTVSIRILAGPGATFSVDWYTRYIGI